MGGVGRGSPYQRCYRQHDEDDHDHDHDDVGGYNYDGDEDAHVDVDDVGGYNYGGQGALFPCFILYCSDDDDDCNIHIAPDLKFVKRFTGPKISG